MTEGWATSSPDDKNFSSADGIAETLPAVQTADPVLALIERMSVDPNSDVEKLERMVAMYERGRASSAREAYIVAMNLAQNEIQPVARTAENTQTRSFYAKLEHVDAAIRPIYLRHGFSLSYDTVEPLVAGNVRVRILCAHNGGHVEEFHREAGPDTVGPKGMPTKTALHGIGSTETFLKRYGTCGIFNVVFKNMDDDGNGGPLSEAQIAQIVRLITESGVPAGRFLKMMGAKINPDSLEESVATIEAHRYPEAISTLAEQLAKRNKP